VAEENWSDYVKPALCNRCSKPVEEHEKDKTMRLAVMTAVLILSAAATYGQHKVPDWKPLAPPAH
jgi:hypothetical protein